jgi:hypothetical protein
VGIICVEPRDLTRAWAAKFAVRFIPSHLPSTPNGAAIDEGRVFTRVTMTFAVCDCLQHSVYPTSRFSPVSGMNTLQRRFLILSRPLLVGYILPSFHSLVPFTRSIHLSSVSDFLERFCESSLIHLGSPPSRPQLVFATAA